jgi:molybdopterin-guanine dinucleotide biosynthesis protein A
MVIAPEHITGLVLAGGRGSRMGGLDKGLQPHLGRPLAQHALERLRPQVGRVALNANRNLAAYAAMGWPVWPDALPEHPGPLAGFLAGLAHCGSPWLLTVPCDTPNFPNDLVVRLAEAATAADAEIAMAATRASGGAAQSEPVFCLMRTELHDSLRAFTESGQRKVERWALSHRCVQVVFDDAAAFANANTLDELQQLQRNG